MKNVNPWQSCAFHGTNCESCSLEIPPIQRREQFVGKIFGALRSGWLMFKLSILIENDVSVQNWRSKLTRSNKLVLACLIKSSELQFSAFLRLLSTIKAIRAITYPDPFGFRGFRGSRKVQVLSPASRAEPAGVARAPSGKFMEDPAGVYGCSVGARPSLCTVSQFHEIS